MRTIVEIEGENGNTWIEAISIPDGGYIDLEGNIVQPVNIVPRSLMKTYPVYMDGSRVIVVSSVSVSQGALIIFAVRLDTGMGSFTSLDSIGIYEYLGTLSEVSVNNLVGSIGSAFTQRLSEAEYLDVQFRRASQRATDAEVAVGRYGLSCALRDKLGGLYGAVRS